MSRVATSGASPTETPTVNFSFIESQSSASYLTVIHGYSAWKPVSAGWTGVAVP